MSEKVKDSVFGEMEYKHRWIKKENITLIDKEYTLNIIASAYTGDKICDEQRKAYTAFKGKLDKISRRMPGMIEEYVEDHKNEIVEHFPEIGNPAEAIKYVTPISVVFTRDGKTIIMCNVAWDEENGIGIEVTPKYYVDLQDAFL
ncbi:hypothetical protein SAMN04487759_10176 [Kandleria vitulina]|jgi:hypothetical protein|uniref:DUF6985 domain-containing protein n=1 Tax=Kandleria vitulina TaxID=1630 RepID=A0A1H2PWU6_9FIRM|nr:hypothetical protein [Kandleria vitulina]SDV99331.1 hypothetical protein SAMN04487759_10176 [Kandleria vitulina]